MAAEGFRVEDFKDPGEALSRFMQVDPSYYNLVVTDIRMPNISGFELYLKLKLISSDVKVIFAPCLEVADEGLSFIPGIKQYEIIKKPIEQKHSLNL